MSDGLIDQLQDVLTEDQRIIPGPTNPMGVAREIVSSLYQLGKHHLLRHHRGNFYQYDGKCWPEAEDRGIRAVYYQWLDMVKYIKETKNGPEILDWLPTIKRVNDVIDATRAVTHLDGQVEAPAWTQPHDLNAAEIVVMDNGLLHVPSRTLLPHTPSLFSHYRLPFAYAADAHEPTRWLAFLRELWPHDEDSIAALQEIFGYLLAGGTSLQKIILIVGPKRSGKGTIGRVLTGLLGPHNVAAPTMASLAQNFGLQELISRPLALISDARLSKKSDSSIVVERLLSISGEDSLTIDRKYRDPWTGRLPTRFLILTNEVPSLADASGALASRFMLLVLTTSFYDRENPKLTTELLAEAPAIFNWALLGLDRLMIRGHFLVPPTSQEAIQQIEDLSSPVGAFLRQRCERGAEYEASTEEVWAAWKAWCLDENQHPGNKATFGKNLKATAPNVRRTRPRTEGEGRQNVYAGLRLRDGVGNEPNGANETLGPHRDHYDRDTQSTPNGQSGHGGHGNSPLPDVLNSNKDNDSPRRRCPGCGERAWSLRVGGRWLCTTCEPAVLAVTR